jgi:hypothetical protein
VPDPNRFKTIRSGYAQCAGLRFAVALPLAASAGWQSLQQEARGQTVWFNAWGGDPAVNRYLDWVSGEVKRDYAIDLRIVHIADAADAVKRIQTEARAGRSKGGSVDLLWVNGENFRTLKNANLLQTGGRKRCPTGAMSIRKSRCVKISPSPPTAPSRRGAARSSPLSPAARKRRRAHQPAGAAGFRRRASRQRHLSASAGLYRYRLS